MKAILTPILLASLCLTGTAQTPIVRTVLENGRSADVYDIVVLAEGYRASERAKFDADVGKLLEHWRTNLRAFPFNEYLNCFNVHTVFRASAESGADQPDVVPKILVDTAYEATFNTGGIPRQVQITEKALAARDAALAPASDGEIMVLVNTTRNGGHADGKFATTATFLENGTPAWEPTATHEWGHVFGGLDDEYDFGKSGVYSGPEFDAPNVSKFASGVKWRRWLQAAGVSGVVGSYQGARYHKAGVYRPELTCKMRVDGDPFCVVCREALIKRIHATCRMMFNPSPAISTVRVFQHTTRKFSFENRIASRPHSIAWQVDNHPFVVTQSPAFLFHAGGTIGPGSHTLRARLVDTSSQIRNDPNLVRQHERVWNIDVRPETEYRTALQEVLPADRETSEGTTSTLLPFGQIGDGRYQIAYGTGTITPPRPVRIKGIAFRPDGPVTSVSSSRFSFQLEVSTSRRRAGSLSSRFDFNSGADRVVVFDGTLEMPARTLAGSPNDFVLRIPFSEPFDWHPNLGALLLDFRYRGMTGPLRVFWDAETSRPGNEVETEHHTFDADATQSNGDRASAPAIELDLECLPVPTTLRTIEGNTSTTYPFNRPNSSRMRVQYAYDRSQFSYPGRQRITRLAWRTDRGRAFPSPRGFTIEVALSTGRPDLSRSMSTTFAANHGGDKRIVFAGRWIPKATPAVSGISPFAQVLELQVPFDYSPSRGSLVVDIRLLSTSGVAGPSFDATSGNGTARIFNASNNNATIGSRSTLGLAMCVSAVPIPVLPATQDGIAGGSSTSFPWRTSRAQRAMNAYSGTQLAKSIPTYITHLSWRPQENQGVLGPVTYNAKIVLSTGTRAPNDLSRTFDANHGPDRVEVFNGDISVPRRTSTGSLGDFIITARLQMPFRWDPRLGPLIVDIRKRGGFVGGGLPPGCDAHRGTGLGRVVHTTDRDAAVANFGPQDVALVLQLGGVGCAQAVPYGTGCGGTHGAPIASSLGLPWIPNRRFAFAMFDGVPHRPAMVLLGSTATSIRLDGAGLPGCVLLCSSEVSVSATTDGLGHAVVPAPVPDLPALHGATLFSQWACQDPTARGGLSLSHGLKLVLCH